jgi:hypothetical protein
MFLETSVRMCLIEFSLRVGWGSAFGVSAATGLLYHPLMLSVEQSVELAGEMGGLGENLPQRHFVYHKSHVTRSVYEPGPPLCKASD